MVMTERRTLMLLPKLFKGDSANLLQGKTPEQLRFLESVASARIQVRDGEMTLEQFPKDPNGREMAQALKRELGVIHKAIPIMNMVIRVSNSALVVYGEVSMGEVDSQEGVLGQIEI